MVSVLEFVSGNADRNADKEHTRLATPPHPPNALPRNTVAGSSTVAPERFTRAVAIGRRRAASSAPK